MTGPADRSSSSRTENHLPGGDPTDGDARLAEELRQAHRRLAGLDVDDATKARAVERLLVISDAAKHDTARAARRLDRFLADLDDACSRRGGSPAAEA